MQGFGRHPLPRYWWVLEKPSPPFPPLMRFYCLSFVRLYNLLMLLGASCCTDFAIESALPLFSLPPPPLLFASFREKFNNLGVYKNVCVPPLAAGSRKKVFIGFLELYSHPRCIPRSLVYAAVAIGKFINSFDSNFFFRIQHRHRR